MKKQKIKSDKKITPRLPMAAVKLLRSKGGAIEPKKGGGYNRQKEKQKRDQENKKRSDYIF